ncbi:hypothetical protein F0562_001868 [Nyssa sinensis]|uniref:Uncharacterized protein n=1 Tax=Nyssa sinensis TaxID=561372 RepID=A0A5J5C5T8_9ASTE|nr:hypothetical protein F0562_001868 [Nyssa sinensis]
MLVKSIALVLPWFISKCSVAEIHIVQRYSWVSCQKFSKKGFEVTLSEGELDELLGKAEEHCHQENTESNELLVTALKLEEVNGETVSAHDKENLICYHDGAHAAHGSGGGPPPTKQIFRAEISLPLIGWNLRARISSGSNFRDRPCVSSSIELPCLNCNISEQDDTLRNENSCYLSLEGAIIRGQGSPETTLVFIVENPVQNLPNVAEGPSKDDELPNNPEIIGAISSTVRDHYCSQAIDPSITTPDVDVTTKPQVDSQKG